MKFSALAIYVFSYNRPDFLENCLSSIEHHAEGIDVTVVDDDSSESEVDAALFKVKERVRVIKPSQVSSQTDSIMHGGLYKNMSWALQDAEQRGFKYALFIQDDQQFVRPILISDFERFDEYFDKNTINYELHTCFLKEQFQKLDEKRLKLDKSEWAYHRENNHGGGNDSFSDVGIFHVQRTLLKHGEFSSSEEENENKARSNNAKMGLYRYPFMMWLPFPKSYRGRKRTIRHSLIEWFGGSGFYQIKYMNKAEISELLEASAKKFPVAERYLVAPMAPHGEFWGGGGLSNIYGRGGLRKRLAWYIVKTYRGLLMFF